MSDVMIVEHPLVKHKLSRLRNGKTGSKEFRELANELAMLLCYEATRTLPLADADIQTPMGVARAQVLAGKKMAFIPILRAGLGMLDGVLRLIPAARVGHVGLFRDPDTLQPVKYYSKLPPDVAARDVFILDPMLATGRSAAEAADIIKAEGCKSIKLMSILAAPEGVAHMRDRHPDVGVYLCAIDERLNDEGMIVPGLGDAGDRIFGTK
ncbi:MAG: uracil phosphoribosyltransferase [Oscillospiraceae bacterium]|nr:uracil phosphoribosyltransferase [Oscillospiraceae bacterium]